MRLFVASKVDTKIQQHIASWQQQFSHLPLRHTPKDNLHITLIAPWNTDNIQEAKILLKSLPWHEGAIPMKVNEIITKKSLAWAQIKENKRLSMLRKRLHHVFGKKEERRRHKFHITLTRYNNGHITRHMKRQMKRKVDLEMLLSDITLFRSDVSESGAIYTPIAKISL